MMEDQMGKLDIHQTDTLGKPLPHWHGPHGGPYPHQTDAHTLSQSSLHLT